MTKHEIIKKLENLSIDAKDIRDEVDCLIDEADSIKDQLYCAKDRADQLADDILEVARDFQQYKGHVDEDKLESLLELKDLVYDCMSKIKNHRSSSIKRKEEELDN